MVFQNKKREGNKIINFFRKKGNAVIDGLFIIVILFVFGVVSLTSVYIFNQLYSEVSPVIQSAEAQAMLDDSYTKTPSVLDGIFVSIIFIFWMGSIILSFFIDTHPVWFVFTILVSVIIFIVGGLLANEYLLLTDELSIGSLPMTFYIFDNFLKFLVAYVVSVLISLYAKSS